MTVVLVVLLLPCEQSERGVAGELELDAAVVDEERGGVAFARVLLRGD